MHADFNVHMEEIVVIFAEITPSKACDDLGAHVEATGRHKAPRKCFRKFSVRLQRVPKLRKQFQVHDSSC